jgi:hypothetical protein
MCSICSAPPEIIELVNQAIRAHEKFRDLAARTAFSKAALHRHSQKCLPKITLADHAQKTNFAPFSPVWPLSDPACPPDVRNAGPDKLADNVTLFIIEYEKPHRGHPVKADPATELQNSATSPNAAA